MKFIVDDRVLGRKDEVHFDNFQDAWCALYAKLCGSPKVVECTLDEEGYDYFIIHDYIVRGMKQEVFLEKK